MNKQFLDKTVLVTGAASGIGKASAVAFASEGANVALSDVNSDKGEQLAAEIRNSGGKAMFIRADVSKSADVQDMIKAAVKAFGRLDVCFNNAGIEGPLALMADLGEDDWNRVIATNLSSVFLCMKYQIPELLKAGGGAIVNNASILGAVAFPNASAYTASKHGVIGLTQVAAAEYATRSIRVNAICPGFIATPMLDRAGLTKPEAISVLTAGVPMKRLGKAEEIAAAVVWLSSSAASFVTGHSLFADGGYVAL